MKEIDPIPKLLAKLPEKFRVFPVLFGAVLIHLSLGTYHTFGNMLPYLASYMRNRTDPEVSIDDLMWIPTLQGCFPFAMIIGGFLSSIVGPRAAAFLGCAIMNGGVLLSAFTIKSSLFMFMATYGIMFGFGQGIAYVVAVSSVINWAPESVGLFSGLVAGAFGISAAIFTPIQTALVNPENFVVDEFGYFSKSALLDRIPNIFLLFSFIYAIMQIIGLIFICDPPSNLKTTVDQGRKIRRCLSDSIIVDPNWRWLGTIWHNDETLLKKEDSEVVRKRTKNPRAYDEENDLFIETDIEYSESSSDTFGYSRKNENKKSNENSMDIKKVLKSPTFYALFWTLFCCSFYGNLYYNLYKTFSNSFIDDDMFMAMAFSVGTVANAIAIARIGWGIFADKFSFQFALTIATSSATVLLFTMPYTIYGGKLLYLFWLIFMFICAAANQTLFITAAVKCFGSKHKAVNYGSLILSTTISGILLSAVCQTLLSKIGYHWMFTSAAIFAFFASSSKRNQSRRWRTRGMSKDLREEITNWRLGESNFSVYFLLKILNRHCPDWTFGEDIRTLTKVPETSLISEGKGFSSKIYSVKLFLEENKEYGFCVKIPSTFHLESSIMAAAENLTEDRIQEEKQKARRMIAQGHLRELNFYKFASQNIPPNFMKIPKFIYGREWTKDQEGIILMEDFSPVCKKEFVLREPFSHPQILLLIEQIAKLQISSIKKENLIQEFPILENTVNSISKYAHLSCEILLSKNLDFFTEEIAAKILDFSKKNTLIQLLSRISDDIQPVLVHSAIWPGNVLWDSEDEVELISILDWQSCFFGSPTADLAALLAISVTGQERRLHEDEYLQYFVVCFNNLRNQSSEKEKIPILNFEIIKENYGKSLLYSMIELVIIIVTNPLDDVPEPSESLGTMTKRLKFLIEDVFE